MQDSILGEKLVCESARFLDYGGDRNEVTCAVQLDDRTWVSNGDALEGSLLIWTDGQLDASVFLPRLFEKQVSFYASSLFWKLPEYSMYYTC
jgi:hypothetical protein